MSMYAIAQNSGSDIPKGTKVHITELFPAEGNSCGRSFYFPCPHHGKHFGLEFGCAHLNGGDWKIVEEDDAA